MSYKKHEFYPISQLVLHRTTNSTKLVLREEINEDSISKIVIIERCASSKPFFRFDL